MKTFSIRDFLKTRKHPKRECLKCGKKIEGIGNSNRLCDCCKIYITTVLKKG